MLSIPATRTATASTARRRPLAGLASVSRSIGHRFELHRELGRGGLGRVFEASERGATGRVALKLLRDPRAPGAADILRREVEVTRKLAPIGAVAVLDAGWLPGDQPYFTMPILAGGNLARSIASAPELAARVALLPRLCAAARMVDRAHRLGVIHRDLKPHNLMLDGATTHVIDWGVATGTDADCTGITGTPAYMAPEQAADGRADATTDVYGLGATLYHLLAGARPYRGATWVESLHHLLTGPPPPIAERAPGLAPALVAVVERAMAREPGERYPDPRAFADALSAAMLGA